MIIRLGLLPVFMVGCLICSIAALCFGLLTYIEQAKYCHQNHHHYHLYHIHNHQSNVLNIMTVVAIIYDK